MARKNPLITRTVKSTKSHVLLYNKDEKKTEETDIVVSRTYKTEKDLEKKLVSWLEESMPNYKLVTIISTEITTELRGMTEDDFIRYSNPIVKSNSEQ